MKLLTADKDPNFLNRLEARSRVVAPCDALDHVARVAAIVPTPRTDVVSIDPATGRDSAEPNAFRHPLPIEKENGYCVQPSRNRNKPEKVTLTNRKGKKFEAEAPFHYNAITGEREYVDLRPPARRIASDAKGNPLTFATKPGESSVPKAARRTSLADMANYDDDDPASLMERK